MVHISALLYIGTLHCSVTEAISLSVFKCKIKSHLLDNHCESCWFSFATLKSEFLPKILLLITSVTNWFIYISFVIYWNSLHCSVREAISLSVFKCKIKSHLFDNHCESCWFTFATLKSESLPKILMLTSKVTNMVHKSALLYNAIKRHKEFKFD